MKLLLVDDNVDDMKEVCDLIRLYKHQVVHITNYEDIVKFCENAKDKVNLIDGIILDLMFPPKHGMPLDRSEYGYRGGQIIYEEKLCNSFPETPFVVYTAMDDTTAIFKSVIDRLYLYKTFKGWFQKPYNIVEIINALQ